jgi:small neutral amino acid transporter SnatA (MarC family)
MAEQELLTNVRHKTRRRLAYALVILSFYFVYLLNYLPVGEFLSHRLGTSWVTGSLAMFAGLVVLFIAIELLFLAVHGTGRGAADE